MDSIREQKTNIPMYLTVFSGKRINPIATKRDDIDWEDIMHSLSMQCRFNGHIKEFYSVAQHCVLVYNLAVADGWDPYGEVALSCLMHDATEAYLMDIPTPIKIHLPEYMKWEDELWEEIASYCKLPNPMPKEVHEYDKIALKLEMNALFLESPNLVVPEWAKPFSNIKGLGPIEAYNLYFDIVLEVFGAND